MRKKILKFIASMSSIIGYIIIGVTSLRYVTYLIHSENKEDFTIGLTALVLFSGFSALCFSYSQILNSEEKQECNYAGEKFMHSSLLILQTVLLKYAYIKMIDIHKLMEYPVYVYLIKIFFFSVVFVCCAMGVYFALFGFQSINDLLWKRYLSRI